MRAVTRECDYGYCPPGSVPHPYLCRLLSVLATCARQLCSAIKHFATQSHPVLHADVGAEGKFFCDQEFNRIWEQETSARRDVPAPCRDPRRRVITSRRRKSEHIEKSWHWINSVLDFSSASQIRKIADLRLTNVSVTQLGSFVYVAWIKGDGRVYIGQTGGRARRRSVGQRGHEHVQNGMDVVRLRRVQKLRVPSDLYQLFQNVGVQNLVITPWKVYHHINSTTGNVVDHEMGPGASSQPTATLLGVRKMEFPVPAKSVGA